ncbi:PREDICTED: uncharacterized protein LOC108509954, partial [Lepidothrix coronata]|uniref:Uncharacterized protein LOC108509954 n=1 Tax=Lepidothrix coronata TaxID=321398 RepID=A0A6J0J7Y2_9PASS
IPRFLTGLGVKFGISFPCFPWQKSGKSCVILSAWDLSGFIPSFSPHPDFIKPFEGKTSTFLLQALQIPSSPPPGLWNFRENSGKGAELSASSRFSSSFQSGGASGAAGDQNELLARISHLEVENQNLRSVVSDLQMAIFKLESRLNALEKSSSGSHQPSPVPPTQVSLGNAAGFPLGIELPEGSTIRVVKCPGLDPVLPPKSHQVGLEHSHSHSWAFGLPCSDSKFTLFLFSFPLNIWF